MTTSTDGATYAYDANGNLTGVTGAGNTVTMAYDQENRLVVHQELSARTTYTYDGDGLKRSERSGTDVTTLIWDGSEYLGEKS